MPKIDIWSEPARPGPAAFTETAYLLRTKRPNAGGVARELYWHIYLVLLGFLLHFSGLISVLDQLEKFNKWFMLPYHNYP